MAYTKEPFLLIKVQPGATPEEIGKAVTAALELDDNPFFWYKPPSSSQPPLAASLPLAARMIYRG